MKRACLDYLHHAKDFLWNNKKNLSIRLIIYMIGVYLFGLGVTLYLTTGVGESHVDVTNYSLIAVAFNGLEPNGHLNPADVKDHYGIISIWNSLVMYAIGSIMQIMIIVRGFRKTKSINVIVDGIVVIILDLIPTFGWSLFIIFNQQIVVPNFTRIGDLSEFQRVWIFMGSFFLYTIGISLAVWADLFIGPYNHLSTNLQKLTNWNYKICRLVWDAAIASISIFVLYLSSIPTATVNKYFEFYIGFGTIFMTFLNGPTVGYFLVFWKKLEQKILLKIQNKSNPDLPKTEKGIVLEDPKQMENFVKQQK